MTVVPVPVQPALVTGRWLTPVGTGRVASPHAQGTLALSYRLSNGLDAAPRPRLLSAVPDDLGTVVPDAKAWACRFLQAVIEVVSSDRPLPQLARWATADVYDLVGRAQRAQATRRRAATGRPVRQYVASVHVFQPDDEIAEVAARVNVGQRSRAIAARLEFERQRWTCHALTLG